MESFTSPKVIGMLSYNLLLHDLRNPDSAFQDTVWKGTGILIFLRLSIFKRRKQS